MKKTPGQVVVSVGLHVEIELVHSEGSDELAFDIVTDEYADFARGFLGAGTPLAQAILGYPAGSTVPYQVGDAIEVKILRLSNALEAPKEDVQKRRQEVIRRAVDQSDRTNAMIFASSFSGKWGDYDPTGFGEDEMDGPGSKPSDQAEDTRHE